MFSDARPWRMVKSIQYQAFLIEETLVILNALRLLMSLSAYHYTVIIFTILLPSGLSLTLPYFDLIDA